MSDGQEGAARGLDPVKKTVVVPAAPDAAFQRFTREIGSWWPLEQMSVHGKAVESVAFGEEDGGRIVERTGEGAEAVWGTVTTWDPPHRVAFTWHPGDRPSSEQTVAVAFVATTDGGTEVTLVHGGWESLGAAAAAERGKYDAGWDHILALYRDSL